MIRAAAMGEINIYSTSIPDLKERFDRVLSHLTATRNLPDTPTLLKTEAGFRVMDGNHRLAAYSFFKILAESNHSVIQPQRFWVASI
ncbi:hypothetical protein [Hydrogenophaga taeniospiralis]|uniref:hypothetical protein n=1 Tax=Hydrogenophaga taeniospiralis TaxID=65656 RepID=UPI0012F85C5D|nr:hypothetical protein [Hydrogenophaga taeniospiralis]